MTELESLALLIADLNAQLRAAQARIRELEQRRQQDDDGVRFVDTEEN